MQHGFYARPRLRRWSIVWFATFFRSVAAIWFATPWTPPLWQRGFFLVNCFVLRRFLTSERSGVVKPSVIRSERSVSDTHNQTLTELEANDWGDPEFSSHLATTVHKLRHKPTGDFTTEDLRITIGQSVGLPYLIPLAIAKLELEPLAEGDFYPGDLLCSVIAVDNTFWQSARDLLTRMITVVTSARDSTDDTEIRNKCDGFVCQWTP